MTYAQYFRGASTPTYRQPSQKADYSSHYAQFSQGAPVQGPFNPPPRFGYGGNMPVIPYGQMGGMYGQQPFYGRSGQQGQRPMPPRPMQYGMMPYSPQGGWGFNQQQQPPQYAMPSNGMSPWTTYR